ncbi:hypothetical protein BO82DRAFT_51113 [Aspergillus uvarum CBS 121591]|uniref:Zn(2)-C6 fungal-type domain-containing protein n=1 Tax=Aspergillus uvarum CBS 121591 TaxID=1448315 RepID=A0A319E6N7_9EURO|nr:hypothetical protein BO82DRAFT_51113 [Aspergillus uvarum CBS 121591]PYH86722.1 hypothetical protein BO82DRAFT_51113 [Aspergillus uvarum CBS 121591]
MEKGNPRHIVSAKPKQNHIDNKIKKRVSRACNRCRTEKAKCDGADPCHRCRASGTNCTFQRTTGAKDRAMPKRQGTEGTAWSRI